MLSHGAPDEGQSPGGSVSRYAAAIVPYVDAELRAAAQAEGRGDGAQAFKHLERAHVLAQPSTRQHVRTHWHMLQWGCRHRDWRECFGQVTRMIGAATLTAIGMVPTGNTGGSNVSPLKPMPVPGDLAEIIARARAAADRH
jgi:hypothetical protein